MMGAQAAAHSGGCLCGAIRFRVEGTPQHSVICHCASCRRATGAPSVAWLTFGRDQLEFQSGEPRAYRSSPDVVRRFCGTCGTALTYEVERSPDTIDVTTVSLDDPDAFPPTGEVWVEHRLPWEEANAQLRQWPKGSIDP